MRRTFVALIFVAMMLAVAASAQMEMPKPGPELQKLSYFVGTWTFEGDMKPGPMGPGGKFTGTSHYEWMDGKFFVSGHSDMKGAMGNGTSLSVMGYDTNQKKYTYHEFNSMGEAESATGTMEGDTWSWSDENKMNGQTMWGHYIMKILSPTSYSVKYEISQDGKTFATVMEGKGTKH
jgi:hypothetical protein